MDYGTIFLILTVVALVGGWIALYRWVDRTF
jgi:hypothetical protein